MGQVNLVGPDNEVVSVPSEQLQQAIDEGYRQATPEEVKKYFEAEEFTSLGSQAQAFAAGAARALTFGASDVALTQTGLVEPETLKKLEEYNPIESLAGEASAIAGSMLVPGAGAATIAGRAARAVTAPVRGATELGMAVTRGVSEVLPAGTIAATRMAQQAAAIGAGGAIEGAMYGLGRAITEDAIGQADLNAEALVSHVGISALLGGAFGSATGLIGKGAEETLSKLRSKMGDFVAPDTIIKDEIGNTFGIVNDAINMSKRTSEEQLAYKKAMSLRRADADDIEAAALMLGKDSPLPIIEEHIVGSETGSRMAQTMRKSGTPLGSELSDKWEKGWRGTAQRMDEVLGPEVKDSLAQLGRTLKDGITQEFEKRIGPITQLYDEIGQALPNIEIGQASRKAMARSVRKLLQEQSLTPNMAQYKYIENIAKDLMFVDNLQKLQNWRSALGREVAPENRYIAGIVREKLNDLETRTIKKSLDLIKEPERRVLIDDLLNKIETAKPAYRKLREEMERVGKNVLGRKKIYGPQDFLDAIEDAKGVEGFAKALLKKENSEFMQFMQREFPDQFRDIMRFHRQQIREAATKDGFLNPKKVVQKSLDLEPELQKMIFTPQELSIINAAETYLRPYAINHNPSGTSYAESMARVMGFRGIADIIPEVMRRSGDKIKQAHLRSRVNPEQLFLYDRLINAAGKTLKKIESSTKLIFAPQVRAFAASKIAENLIEHKNEEKLLKQIREIASNPEMMIDRLSQDMQGLHNYAPNVAQQIQISAARAIQYLAQNAPVTSNGYALSEEFQPSRLDMNLFAEKVNLIQNPQMILDAAAAGTLVPEQVSVVKTVFPAMYQMIQNQVVEQLIDAQAKKKPIGYRQKNMLAMLLGQDLDASMTPDAILKYQTMIQAKSQESERQDMAMMGAIKPTQKGLGNLQQSFQTMTAAQASGQRIDRG